MLVVLVLATFALHRLGETFPPAAITDPYGQLQVALPAVLRLIGLGIAYWLLGTTALYAISRLLRLSAALKSVRWMTIRPMRRLVDGMLAGGLAVTMSMPAIASSTAPGYVPVPAGDPVPLPPATNQAPDPVTPAQPTTAERDVHEMYVPVTPIRKEPPVPTLGAIEVIVKAGDSMWKLAEERIVTWRGNEATDADIAPYWLAVIGANKNRIRSGDPDLIYPGEVLILPALDQ
ncbi:MAG: LysM peptidoglycan-binding domain-containing protein [Actinomycetota bacterium]